MPRKNPIEDKYTQSFARIAADNSLLEIQYAAPSDPNRHIEQVRTAVEAVLKEIHAQNSDLDCHAGFLFQPSGQQCFEVSIKHTNGKPLTSTELKYLANKLRGEFVIKDETSAFIRAWAEGKKVDTQTTGSWLTMPLPTAPATSAPAPSALHSLYSAFMPLAASATAPLRLHFALKAPMLDQHGNVDAKVQADYTTLSNAVDQAIQAYNQANGTQIQPAITQATSHQNLRSEFQVGLSKPHGAHLTLSELEGVADALFHANILTGAFAARLKQTSPAPVPQAVVPLLGMSSAQPLYQSVSPVIGQNTMKLRYTLHGDVSQPYVQTNSNALKQAIDQAIRAMPARPDGSTLEAKPGPTQSHANPNGGSFNACFEVEILKRGGAPHPLQADDMIAAAEQLEAAQCLSLQELVATRNDVNFASAQHGWVRATAMPVAQAVMGVASAPINTTNTHQSAIKVYDSCTPSFSGNALTLEYTLSGTGLSSIRNDYNSMKKDIEYAIGTIPPQLNGSVKVNVSGLRWPPGMQKQGNRAATFTATIQKMLRSVPQSLQFTDVEQATKKIEAIGCLTAADKQAADASVATPVAHGMGRGGAGGSGGSNP